MTENPRGPYSQIRWFCNDGTTQPPTAFACRERGGGRQHAEYSRERVRLAELGWSVGTIFAALSYAELADDSNRRQRLRELALERYLTDIDDGWVLRRARNYRGRAQVEGEEATGRELLLMLLADREWIAGNFLLARESARVIPHVGNADDIARDVRREAIELADRDRSFEPLRAEIHGAPSATTAARVRAWADGKPSEIGEFAGLLAGKLDVMYGAAGRAERLTRHATALARRSATAALAERLGAAGALPADQRFGHLATLIADARTIILAHETSASVRLALFDLISDVESELSLTTAEVLGAGALSRQALLASATKLVDAAYGAGFLTPGEYAALRGSSESLEMTDSLALGDYAALLTQLRRVPQWASGSVRQAFAEPLLRYTALDARAGGFVDDVLRSSPLVGLAEVTRRLARDLAALTGVAQSIAGETGVSAFGLNAGIARGPLKVFATQEALEAGQFARTDIVVLPETTAELAPVAGIVTLGEGNPLSHVQLLARNFGIPNIAIASDVLPVVARLEHREVLSAVASDGSVALLPFADVPAALQVLVLPANERGAALTVPPPDLSVTQPVRLAELNAGLSGRVVGPKAANLGELARLFPGRVAPAIAIPFGIYSEHVLAGEDSPRSQLIDVYAQRAAGLVDDEELAILLAGIRHEIARLELAPDRRADLLASMRAEFGEPGTYGIFVRSDTNVEDLPQFTGAGLSETVPNVTDVEALFAAIPRVWSSVLSPRAIAWRSSLLTNPEEVYASVLLMQSVPSDKSGVMVTTNVAGAAPGVTVSTAWGVGGAVGGEATETIVLHADGTQMLVSEAKAAYRRELDPAGGLAWRPAADGAVLTAEDKAALRALAIEVERRYTPVLDENGVPRPWDIEFGFVAGELTLFQIRPLVERGQQLADRIVRALVPGPAAAPPERIALGELPLGTGG